MENISLWHLITLSIIQGVTEFLPVSSSAHLALFPHITGLKDQGLDVDIALHSGSIVAVILVFRTDVGRLLSEIPRLFPKELSKKTSSQIPAQTRPLLFHLLVATLPVLLVGFCLKVFLDALLTGGLRSLPVLASSSIFFGILLWLADQRGGRHRRLDEISFKDSVVFGFAQTLALIPGTSRSGITMTAGRFLGFSASEAARFSLLMAIPVIIAAMGLTLWYIRFGHIRAEAIPSDFVLADLSQAFLFSFLGSYLAIRGMMRLLARAGFTPFVIYRILLGFLLWGVYFS